MKGLSYYRNKHLLGDLTVADLMNIVPIEGDFSLGTNWYPIGKARRSKVRGRLEIYMDSSDDSPDLDLLFDQRVWVEGDVVRIQMPHWSHLPRSSEVRLRLYGMPDLGIS